MLTINYKEYKEKQVLIEIYHTGWQCALASKRPGENIYTQVMPWVFCKDYFNEIVWSNLFSRSCTVFGLEYDPKKYPMELDRTRVLVRDLTISASELEKQCINARGLLRDFDSLFGFNKTVLKRVQHSGKESIFIFEADKKWLVAAPMLSLFTLLCRIGRFWKKEYKGRPRNFVGYYSLMPVSSDFPGAAVVHNDKRYIRDFADNKGFDKLPKHVFDLFSKQAKNNYSKLVGNRLPYRGENIAQVIHNRGIVAFARSGFNSHKNAAEIREDPMHKDCCIP